MNLNSNDKWSIISRHGNIKYDGNKDNLIKYWKLKIL